TRFFGRESIGEYGTDENNETNGSFSISHSFRLSSDFGLFRILFLRQNDGCAEKLPIAVSRFCDSADIGFAGFHKEVGGNGDHVFFARAFPDADDLAVTDDRRAEDTAPGLFGKRWVQYGAAVFVGDCEFVIRG